MRSFIAALLCFGCSGPVLAQGTSRLGWQPGKTWVFAVGILQWQDGETWAPFPEAQEGRSDQRLIQFFRKQGVPAHQIVYLKDRQATLQRIQGRLAEFLPQPGPGDLLVIYYAGHGWRDVENDRYYFANYDARKADSSDLWQVGSLCDSVRRQFRGSQVLFLADCCHSGGLIEEIRRQPASVPLACLASVHSHSLSTGGWTFTDILLQALRGDGQLDADGNGLVEIDELARYAEREMAFREGQKTMFATFRGFPERLALAEARGRRDPEVGKHVEVLWEDGQWYKAKVLRVTPRGSKVQYVEDESVELVTDAKRLRPYNPRPLPPGTRVLVDSGDGEQSAAIVLQSWYGLHWVRYPDYGPAYDEWVAAESITIPGRQK